MKCHACAADVAGDARICPVCGVDLTKAPDTNDTLTEIVDKAKAVGREAMETDIAKDAQKLAEKAVAAGKQALDSDIGRDVTKMAGDAAAAGKSALNTKMGKEMAVGAAIGAVVAIPIPLIGPIMGAVAGAGIAWFRSKSRNA
nr:hypothetical protein [Polymorphobacter sp.]